MSHSNLPIAHKSRRRAGVIVMGIFFDTGALYPASRARNGLDSTVQSTAFHALSNAKHIPYRAIICVFQHISNANGTWFHPSDSRCFRAASHHANGNRASRNYARNDRNAIPK